ncbi:PIN domain-containing protein [Polynucleobacter necessarius]|uniref:PIN domain-containing protein n=1 Tax=Polynucleobacter necessarius TaxID=576610 RepID=UPI0038CD58E7
MPLPPIPTQIADQVKLSRKDTPDLKKRSAPAKPVVVDASDWANDVEEDLSAAEVALEKIKDDRSPAKNEVKVTAPAKPKRVVRTGPPSLFVLDTNVLMHDPSSLFRFSEHDLFLPMTTLEELDNHKKERHDRSRLATPVPLAAP